MKQIAKCPFCGDDYCLNTLHEDSQRCCTVCKDHEKPVKYPSSTEMDMITNAILNRFKAEGKIKKEEPQDD